MNWLNTLGTAVTVAVGVFTLWRWAFGPLRAEVHHLGTRLANMETAVGEASGQVGGMTRVLVPLLADHDAGDPAKVVDLLGTFNGTWRAVSGWERERRNPLTDEELTRFETYREKVFDKRALLTPAEWADFNAMLEKMNRETPKPPGLPALFIFSAVLGALAGIVIATASKQGDDAPTPRGKA